MEYEQVENNPLYSLTTVGYEGFYIFWDTKMFAVAGLNSIYFVYEEGQLRLLNYADEKLDVSKATCFLPINRKGNHVLSNRGYIWSRSIPMIKNTIFLGHGPDTFLFYFPQYEYDAKVKWTGTPMMIVDKPHNMFIQTAINTGLISLIALFNRLCILLY